MIILNDQKQGVSVERIHPETLRLLQHLSRNEKYVNPLELLAHLLRYATVKQYGMVNGIQDCAVIRIQSIQALCQEPSWPYGYITTHKWVRIFEALGIVEHLPHRDFTELHVMLGVPSYQPDQVIERLNKLATVKTPKVRQVAVKVRKYLEQSQLNHTAPDNLAASRILQLLQPFVCQEGKALDATRSQHLTALSQWIAYTVNPEKYPCPQEGIFFPVKTKDWRAEKKDSSRLQGNSVMIEGNLHTLEFLSSATEETTNSPQPKQLGNSMIVEGNSEVCKFPLQLTEMAPNSPQPKQLGNSNEIEFPTNIHKSSSNSPEFPSVCAEEAPNSPLSSHEGNSDTDLTLNVSNIFIKNTKNNDNVITREEISLVEQEGNSMALLVENKTENKRAYIHFLKKHDQNIVRSVFIYTLQQQILRQQARRPIASPGKYFSSMLKRWADFGSYAEACQAFEHAKQEGTSINLPGIPKDIQALMLRYEGWSLEEIARDLRQSCSVQGRMSHRSAGRATFPATDSVAMDARELRTSALGMTEEEANALLNHVREEGKGQNYELEVGIAMIQDHRAVTVTVILGERPRAFALHSATTWRKDLDDLFKTIKVYQDYIRQKQQRSRGR
jgi:hypothetical protein